jgi:hypothetical protein
MKDRYRYDESCGKSGKGGQVPFDAEASHSDQ